MSDRLEQFFSDLVETGLLTADDQRALITNDGDQPLPEAGGALVEKLVEQLIRQGRVTEFQASLLVAGRGRELRLANYLILEKLGEGGMGAVYKAVHTLLHRIVAVKTIRRAMTDTYAIQRFQQEIEALGRLNHPHVVRAAHAGQANGIWYLVMDFVPGVDLMHVSHQRGALPPADACEIVRQTAAGLQHIHQCGLVHRDIKPSNLMLTAEGTVRILDLGLARLQQAEPQDRRLTAAGQILGTVDYIAPEQAAGNFEVNIRADIYSLGCTLFRLLTGHVPYRAPRYPGKMERILAHITDPFPDIHALRPDLPQSLVVVLHRMVEKLPAARFPSPAEVELALRPFCSGANLKALLDPSQQGAPAAMASPPAPEPERAKPPRGAVEVGAPQAPLPHPTNSRSSWTMSRAASLVALGVTVLVVGGLLVPVVLGRKDARKGPLQSGAPQAGPPLEHLADAEQAAPMEPTEEITHEPPDRTPAEQQRFDAASVIAGRLGQANEKKDEAYQEFFAVLANVRDSQDIVLLLEQLAAGAHLDAGQRKFVLSKLNDFAQTSLEQERLDVAMRLCEAGLNFDPESAVLHFSRGNIYRNRGDYDPAIADYDEALRLDPNSASAFNNRGSAWFNKKEYDKAIADYDEFIRLDPKRAVAYFNRAHAWHLKKEYDKAIVDFDEALRLDPKSAIGFNNRGSAWFCKKEYDKAIADYDEAIRLDPRCVLAFKNRGNTWHSKKDYDMALADFDAALRLDPKDAVAYLNRAQMWYLKKDYDKAIADCDEAIRLNPEFAVAFKNRGTMWSFKKNYAKALADFDEALRLDPKDMLVFHNRGDVWYSKKDYDKAIADHNEGIRIDPKYALGYGLRAKSYAEKREYAKAAADFDEAMRLGPSHWVQREYARFLAACPEDSFRNGERAVELARQAIELAGVDANWRHHAALAAAFAETGDFDEAGATQQTALADTSLDDEDRAEMQSRLDLYKSQKPLRLP